MSIRDTEKIFKRFQRHGTVKRYITIAVHHPKFWILQPALYGLLWCIIVGDPRIMWRFATIDNFSVFVGVHIYELRKRLPSLQGLRTDEFRFIIYETVIQ